MILFLLMTIVFINPLIIINGNNNNNGNRLRKSQYRQRMCFLVPISSILLYHNKCKIS